MSSVNGARQGRSTTVSRGRVHMWTRLGTHHAPRDGREGGRGARGMRWDGTERVHNGYVRQGWILLINPTGYIAFLLRAADALRFVPTTPRHAAFPKQRRRSSSPCQPRSQPRSSTSYSPPFPRRERCPFVGMSCVDAEHCAASVRRYYITLIMRACAKGGTVRRPARPVSTVRKRAAMPRRGSGTKRDHAAPGNYRETITALDLSQVVVDAR